MRSPAGKELEPPELKPGTQCVHTMAHTAIVTASINTATKQGSPWGVSVGSIQSRITSNITEAKEMTVTGRTHGLQQKGRRGPGDEGRAMLWQRRAYTDRPKEQRRCAKAAFVDITVIGKGDRCI